MKSIKNQIISSKLEMLTDIELINNINNDPTNQNYTDEHRRRSRAKFYRSKSFKTKKKRLM